VREIARILWEKTTDAEVASRLVQEMAADCEAVATELSTRFCDMDAYLRLNVDRGMEDLVMNDWGDLGPIETHTSAYVERADISETIEASLRSLQGGTGSVTLGEISTYLNNLSEVLSTLHLLMDVRSTEDRQGRAGRAEYAKGVSGAYF
jgi:hypothetical protein